MDKTDEKKKKVLVIGLDGATFDLIRPWAEQGYLPNIANLIENGVSGHLKSTIPPITSPAWVSFATGMNPGKLGVFDLMKHKVEEHELIPYSTKDIKAETIWKILSNRGFSVGVLNVPLTYPPEKVNGFIISGMPTPSEDSEFTYPKELKSELDKIVDGYELDVKQGEYYSEEVFLKDLYRILNKRCEAAKYLMRKQRSEFFMVVFDCCDRVQHFMWRHTDPNHPLFDKRKYNKYKDSIRDFWIELDKKVGEIIKEMDEDTIVILMSDHGFGINDKVFYINDWLIKNGFLILDDGIKKNILIRNFIIKKLSNILRKLGIYEFIVLSFHEKIRKFIESPYLSFKDAKEKVNWKKTTAYSMPHTSAFGNIYINSDKSQNYTYSGRLYNNVRDEIIDKLKNLRDPITGNRLKVDVYKPEDIYKGEYVGKAPDIIYFIEDLRCIPHCGIGHTTIIERCSWSPKQNASHRMNGIFICTGKGIKKGETITNAEIIDLAPTILHIMGIPIPRDMDGKVLTEIFEEGSELATKPLYEDVKDNKTRKEKEKIERFIKQIISKK